MRETKNLLYEQVSRVSKALASPKRLELIELLCQCEKSVETLARETDMSVKLASAHLRTLRAGRLVETRKDGKYVLYRLADASVGGPLGLAPQRSRGASARTADGAALVA